MTLQAAFNVALTALEQALKAKRWDKVLVQLDGLIQLLDHLRLTQQLTEAWYPGFNQLAQLCVEAVPELDSLAACRPITTLLQSWLDIVDELPGLEPNLRPKLSAAILKLVPTKYQPLPKALSLDELIATKNTIQSALHKVVRKAYFTSRLTVEAYVATIFPYYIKQLPKLMLQGEHPLQAIITWLVTQQPEANEWAPILRYYYVLRENQPAELPAYTDSLLTLQWHAKQLEATNSQEVRIKLGRNPGCAKSLALAEAHLLPCITLTETKAQHPMPAFLALHKDTLTAARQTYQQALAQASNSAVVFVAQQAFGEASLQLLNDLLADSIQLLGESPCEIAFLALGSSARYDRMAYSDVEPALLYEPKAESQAATSWEYVTYLLCLLELKILCLGETPPTNESMFQGFYIDRTHHLLVDKSKLWGTVDYVFHGIVEATLKAKPLGECEDGQFKLDPTLYALLLPRLINHHNAQAENLYAAYTAKVTALLSLVPEHTVVLQTQPAAIPLIPYQQYLGFYVWQSILAELKEPAVIYNVKDRLHKPLVYLALALKFYYGLEASYPAAIFTAAAEQGVIPSGLAHFCCELLALSIQLRNRLHLQAKSQVEVLDRDKLSDEHRQLLVFFEATLIPLWQHALQIFWQGRQAKVDIILGDCIGRVLQGWLNPADNLLSRYSTLTQYLLYTQASLAKHRYYYRQLPAAERLTLMQALKTQPFHALPTFCLGTLVESEGASHTTLVQRRDRNRKLSAQSRLTLAQQAKTLMQAKAQEASSIFPLRFWDMPTESGVYPSHESAKAKWQAQLATYLQTTSPASKPIITVHSLQQGRGYLQAQWVAELQREGYVLADGQFVKKGQHPLACEMAGNHLVIPLAGLYLKVFPEYPLMELFLNDLHQRLGSDAIRPVDVWYWPTDKADYPVLVSQAVAGEPLHEVLQANRLPALCPRSFSAQVLVAALVNFEDAKPDNFIVSDSPTGAKLIAIDNDRWFVPAFAGETLNAKNILFCLEAMHQPLDPVVREEVLGLNPQALLTQWLANLEAWGQRCQQHFGSKLQEFYRARSSVLKSKAFNERTMLLPPLPPYAIKDLFSHLHKLQDVLSEHPQANHWQCLAAINPRLANHYLRVFAQSESALGRFSLAAGPAYQKGNKKSEFHTTQINFETYTSSMRLQMTSQADMVQGWQQDIALAKQQLAAIAEDAQQIQLAAEQLAQGHFERFQQLSAFRQQQLLKDLNFNQLGEKARVLINYLKTQSHYTKLSLQGSPWSDSDVQQLIKNNPGLRTLSLKDCPNLSFNALKGLSDCQYLKRLQLSKLPQLTEVGYANTAGFVLVLAALEQLTVTDCAHLEFIAIQAKALRKLKLKACPKLKAVTTHSLELEALTLLACPAWPLPMLQKVASDFKNLQKYVSDNSHLVHRLLSICVIFFNFDISLLSNNTIQQLIMRLEPHSQVLANLLPEQRLAIQGLLRGYFDNAMLRLKVLEKGLTSKKDETRHVAAESLGLLGQASYNGKMALINALDGKDITLRQYAATSLVQLGESIPKAMEILLESLRKDKKMGVLMAAARSLTQLGQATPEIISALIKGLSEEDWWDITGIAESLIHLSQISSDVIPSLINTLDDKDKVIRLRVARILIKLKHVSSELISVLMAALGDEEKIVYNYAAEGLIELGQFSPNVVSVLIKTLASKDEIIRSRAVKCLVKLGQTVTEVLLALINELGNQEMRVRNIVTAILIRLGQISANVVPALIKTLRFEDKAVRRSVAKSLGQIGQANSEIISVLSMALGDEDAIVRMYIAKSLGQLGTATPQVISALNLALSDEDNDVRRQAAESLFELGHITPEVMSIMNEVLIELSGEEDNIINILDNFCQIDQGTREQEAALIKLLNHKSEDVRIQATKYLGKLSQPTLGTISALVNILTSDNEDIGKYALSSLVKLSKVTPNVMLALIGALDNKSLVIRARVAICIGQLDRVTPEVLTALVKAFIDVFKDDEVIVFDSMAKAMTEAEMNYHAYQVFLNFFGSYKGRDLIAQGSIFEISASEPDFQLLYFEKMLYYAKEIGCEKAYAAMGIVESLAILGQMDPELFISNLNEELEANKTYYRIIWLILVKFGQNSPEARTAFIKALENKDNAMSILIAKSLSRLGQVTPEVVLVLIKILDSEHEYYFFTNAAKSLGEIGQASPEVISTLIRALENKRAVVLSNRSLESEKSIIRRASAALSLGKLGQGTPEVLAAICKALSDDSWYIRWCAADSLGQLGQATPEVMLTLSKALKDKNEVVKVKIVQVLAKLDKIWLEQIFKQLNLIIQQFSAVNQARANISRYSFFAASKALSTTSLTATDDISITAQPG